VVTFIDVTSLTQAEKIQKTLIAELNHRVKNMLAMVIALFEQSGKGAASFETFKAGFSDRLHALARSYELLSQVNWRGSLIAEIIKKELAPFDQDRIKLTGMSVVLSPRQALSLGMIVHELATNAAKFGAFSDNTGRVEIEWKRDGAEDCVFAWREHDGPPPKMPIGEGFGFKLIEREASAMLGGKPQFDFSDEGFALTLRFRIGG
jgi:two-component system CheB/CheR fusion protein